MVDGSKSSIEDFYPRSPCGERPNNHAEQQAQHEFLSTLSLRRATFLLRKITITVDISIHALLAESDAWNRFTQRRDFISIHALLAESDRKIRLVAPDISSISIHALLAESDMCEASQASQDAYFYPRSPCGERLLGALWVLLTQIFLSTLSLRRATI